MCECVFLRPIWLIVLFPVKNLLTSAQVRCQGSLRPLKLMTSQALQGKRIHKAVTGGWVGYRSYKIYSFIPTGPVGAREKIRIPLFIL